MSWVGLNRLDWDDARVLKECIQVLEHAADEAEMAAIEHEVEGK